eukprot:TRINITY_DN6513_c0_g1_i5.p1 TRINITY_DN6513_c0_g1~~TRINITY_DN6513_c0_g1_i5.p1  ORF type:complete len:197 (-),score=25.52 TRINITY_DN6513_c0_g1_i5:126-716(-)
MRAALACVIASLFVITSARFFNSSSQQFIQGWYSKRQRVYNDTIIEYVSDDIFDPKALANCIILLGNSDTGSRFKGAICASQLFTRLRDKLKQRFPKNEDFYVSLQATINILSDAENFISDVNEYGKRKQTDLWPVLKQSSYSVELGAFYGAGCQFGIVIEELRRFSPGYFRIAWLENLKRKVRGAFNNAHSSSRS